MTVIDDYERLLEKDRPSAILQLAEQLKGMHRFRAERNGSPPRVFDNDAGSWITDGVATIEEELYRYYPSISSGAVREVVEKIRQSSLLARGEQFVGAIDGDWLHVDNGWLNMDTLELEPHSPDRLSTGKINAAFDRKAVATDFTKMITRALPEVEYRRRLLKVMGNLLIPDARYEKATLLVGEGHNRKGSILFALGQVLGEENVCAVSLQELANDRFAAARLHNKMANLDADLDADRITRSGWFKKLVSGDLIQPHEKFGQPFNMHNFAKSIYSTNTIPVSDDQTYAFFRRWEIIPFYVSFERDPMLQARLSASQEKSGILNFMLAGRRLLLSEGFDETSIERVRFLYNQNASVARDFLEKECVIDLRRADYLTKAATLQNAYVDHCVRHKGKKPSDRNTLIQQLGRELDRLGVDNRQRRPSRERYYMGVMLLSEMQKTQGRLL